MTEAARVLYRAFNIYAYSPSWDTASNKTGWRRAAEALLIAIEDGIV